MPKYRPVWSVLVDEEGQAYKEQSANNVKISAKCSIVELKKAVHAEYPNILAGVDAGELKVYPNKGALDGNRKPLDVEERIGNRLGKEEKLIVVVPSHAVMTVSDGSERAPKKQRISVSTDRFKAFTNAQIIDNCIISADGKLLPYPNKELQKIFVRTCYEDIYALLMAKIKNGVNAFGISGTPGIGKSLFFIYILYRLVHDQSSQVSFKRIIYQTADLVFTMFDLENYSVFEMESFGKQNWLRDPQTFYIIDGGLSAPFLSACIVLFIASPRSKRYRGFVKQRDAQEWYMPVWSFEELAACCESCYPDFAKK
ncbi:hypothetical protein AC1031_001233 [Aphanomyces cochlioides]|nr:hypothetical protein AC1031_001233 [Aphanomyces cochlioides]